MWRVLQICHLGVVIHLLTISSSESAQIHIDDFESETTDGWVGNMFSQPAVQPTGGPAGNDDAFLLVSTSSPTGPGSNLATYNSGANWTGDFNSIEATTVTADLMNPPSSPEMEIRLVLFGPQFVSERWTSTDAVTVPNDGLWRNFEFSLAEEELTQVGGADTYENLFSNVLRVMLRHDDGIPSAGGSPVDGSFGIDNIQLLSETTSLPGDFDGDNDVDGYDFLFWQRQSSIGNLEDWEDNFGATQSSISSITTPEPSALIVLIVGLIAHSSTSRERILWEHSI